MQLTFKNTIGYILYPVPFLYLVIVGFACGFGGWLFYKFYDFPFIWAFIGLYVLIALGYATKNLFDWWNDELIPALIADEEEQTKIIQNKDYTNYSNFRSFP